MSLPYAEVIGDPISQSKSPLIHKFWLGKLGIDGDYRATRVTAGDLSAYFEARRSDPHWRGCNITMPLKFAARSFAVHRTDPSFPPEPINLAVPTANGELEGHALDTPGFVAALLGWRREHPDGPGPNFAGQSGPALVLGAGGAARAATWGLAHFGYAPIWVLNRTAERAKALARDYAGVGARLFDANELRAPVSLLVNASALGMEGHPEPVIPNGVLGPDTLVFDLVTTPARTGLLRQAQALGLRTLDGLDMLVEQARPSFCHLFGVLPPGEHDAELRASLLP